ncbi:MAG: SdrD B-like domain-containing protein, partial [Angustibacter sp.]
MARTTLRLIAAGTTMALTAMFGAITSLPAAQAAPGPLSGTVFRDYNANGARNTATGPAAVDPGLPGVTVQAYGPSGALVGSTTSTANGSWSIAPSADGPYRIEFTNPPAGFQPSSSGAIGENTTVQFAPAAGETGIDIGYNIPSEYCQDNPDMVTSCYIYGPSAGNNNPVVVSFPYNAGTVEGDTVAANIDNPTAHALMIPHSQVGSTWGLAYERSAKTLY